MLYPKIALENIHKSLIILNPIMVRVIKGSSGYRATWIDGKVFGFERPTYALAIKDIKSLIFDVFTMMEELPDENLGKEMLRQKRILQNYLKRK